MATDDRKRRILDHLSRSTSGADYIPKKPLPIVETPRWQRNRWQRRLQWLLHQN